MNLSKLLPINKNKEILVCATDGFSLSGVVYSRSGSELNLLHQKKVANMDMAEALTELTEQLQQEGWQGGHAVLLSPAVLNALIELPVNPKKQRPLSQMTELVRWEVEPLLMQHTTRWSVGHLLVGQGYMTTEQAQAVMDLQQGKANPAGGVELAEKYSFRRFGELAEELGYIRNSQLKAVLKGQEWLKSDDDAIECGWTGHGEVPDVPGMYFWQVSAVNQSLFERWRTLFKQQGMILDAMYPLMGASTGNDFTDFSNDSVVELYDSMMLFTQYENGRLSRLSSYFYQPETMLTTLIDVLHADTNDKTQLWLVNCSEHFTDFQSELEVHLEREINVLSSAKGHDHDKNASLIEGTALQRLGKSSAKRLVEVRDGGPLPPIMQRQSFRAAVLVGLILTTLMGSEIYLAVEESSIKQFKAEIDARWQTVDQAKKAITEQSEQIAKRQKLIDEQKSARSAAEATLTFYAQELPGRNALVKGVLGSLSQIVPDDVILMSIDELGKRVPLYPVQNVSPHNQGEKSVEVENFNLRAWAVNEASAQTFIQLMKENVMHLGLTVKDPIVREDQGPLSLSGYAVGLRLVKLMPQKTP